MLQAILLVVTALLLQICASALQADPIGAEASLPLITGARARSIAFENPKGEPHVGAQARGGRKGAPYYDGLVPGSKFTLMDVDGPGIIKHIWITTRPRSVEAMRNVIVRMWWDGEETPSVEAPFLDFFGQAHGIPQPLYSSLVTVTSGRGFNCYFNMPFAKHARIEFDNQSNEHVTRLFYQIDYHVMDKLPEDYGYFHAQWRRQNPTVEKQDYVLVDNITRPGVYIGTVVGVHVLRGGWWGEGEFKFYMEGDDQWPTIAGTGTEDYFCSAWGLDLWQHAYHGCTMNDNGWYSLYRWHVPDPIPFGELKKVTAQQLGWRPDPGIYERSDDWCSTAYWYQLEPHNPFPPLPNREARMKDLRPRIEKPQPAKVEVGDAK